mmetsp:Transcript_2017/g.7358  ORF Transcript_2017/g.7358 Transcript_2017/m.7358 type:complete len:297 (-) Transcript_2017:494-1384(-)
MSISTPCLFSSSPAAVASQRPSLARGASSQPVNKPNLLCSVRPCRMMTSKGGGFGFLAVHGRALRRRRTRPSGVASDRIGAGATRAAWTGDSAAAPGSAFAAASAAFFAAAVSRMSLRSALRSRRDFSMGDSTVLESDFTNSPCGEVARSRSSAARSRPFSSRNSPESGAARFSEKRGTRAPVMLFRANSYTSGMPFGMPTRSIWRASRPSMFFTRPRMEFPCATTMTVLPHCRSTDISSHTGSVRSRQSLRLSEAGMRCLGTSAYLRSRTGESACVAGMGGGLVSYEARHRNTTS